MSRHLAHLAAASLATVVAVLLGSVGLAQAPVTRVVLVPFDASRSVDALGLATPGALQRALNQVDGLFVPPVGDALIVLQRSTQAGIDPIAEMERLFEADAVVLGRISGTGALEVELVVTVDGEDRSETVRGSVSDLSALWRALADRIVALAGLRVGGADLVELREVLADAPEPAVLGQLGIATARLPGTRFADLETALSLDDASTWLRSEAARAAALEGETERAVELAEGAAAAAPGHVEVRAIEGIVRAAAGDRSGATAAFGAALDGNPAHAVALAGLADLTEDVAERTALLERAVAASPRLIDAQLALARLQTSPQRQLQALRRAAERLPDSVVTQRALIEMVLSMGDARGALALLRQAVSSPIGASAALYTLAALMPADLASEALDLVRQGRERFPGARSLALAEADLLVASGELDAAEGVLREALEADPAATEVAETLSTVLARQGRVDEARTVLEGIEPRPADLDLRIVELQLAAGRARVALEALEPRVAAGEDDPMLRTLYGIALGRVGRIDEAERVLQGVVDENVGAEVAQRALDVLAEQRQVAGAADLALEGDAAVAFEQGLHALELGEYHGAAAAFARARSAQDAGLLAFYEGFARQNHGDVRGAIAAYLDARASLGDNDVLLNNLGFAQLQVGRIDLALDTLRAAVAANDRNAQAQLNLALTYYQIGNYAEALARFEAAVALAPELAESAAPFIEEARRRTGQ